MRPNVNNYYGLVTRSMAGLGLMPAMLGAAAAQETDVDASIELAPITVNARLIEEPIQRIPFGISVQDNRAIEDRRLDNSQDLARVTPGLNLGDFGIRNGNIPNIRGVGSFFPLSGDDASVPVFIDGIPVAVRSQNREFFDVERIEVLRGPQNTLYGRNAQAGAISVTSIAPGFIPEVGAGLEIGTDEHRRLDAFVSGPLDENLAGRAAARWQEQDGDVSNDSAGGKQRSGELINATASLLWQPLDSTEMRLNLRYDDYDETPLHILYTDLPNFPRAFQDTQPVYEMESLGVGLTVEHQFDSGFTLTSLTGVQRYESLAFFDDSDGYLGQALTGLPPTVFDDPGAIFRELRDDDIQYSQEFRLNGKIAEDGTWIAGLNVFQSEFELTADFNSPGFVIGEIDNDFDTTSYSTFGELTYPVTERLNAIAGLRYTLEDKQHDTVFTDASEGMLGFDGRDSGDKRFDLLTGRAAVTYDLAETVTVFGSVARGGKTGGFQLGDLDVATGGAVSEYDNALTWTTEVGVRGTVLDNRLRFAASAFFNDTRDEHLQVFDLNTFEFIIENADTETYGLELEADYQITPSWRLDAMLALLETEITASDDPTISEGNQVPYAPQVSYALGAEYETDWRLLGMNGVFSARAAYQYVGDRANDLQNAVDLDSYGMVNFRLGWRSDNWGVYAFVDNAFDEDYIEATSLFGTTPTGELVTSSAPGRSRQVGVGLSVRF